MQAPRRVMKNRGFSLIELLIALLIITISMLALLNSILVSIRTNVQNDIRNATVRITNQTAEALLAIPWTKIGPAYSDCTSLSDPDLQESLTAHKRILGDASQDSKGLPVPRLQIRNFQQDFNIQWLTTCRSTQLMQIVITVTPSNKGVANTSVIYKHSSI